MAKSKEDKGSAFRATAMGVGTMVLAVMSFLVALWVIMALVRLLLG